MRIVQLNPFYFPYAGGIERRIEEFGRRLKARGHEVTVVTSRLPKTQREEERNGLRVVRLSSTFRFGRLYNPPLVRSKGIEATLRDLAPDVVDFHYRWSPSYSKAFRSVKAGRVFTYHNTYGEGTGLLGVASRFNDRVSRRTVLSAHRILCISDFIRRDLEQKGFPKERLDLVPNGIDSAALGRLAAAATEIDPRRIVAVGRLVDTKGFDLAIRAIVPIVGMRLTICGEGPRKGALLRLARRLGVADRVELPGWVPEEEKLALLASSLACVHPARFESFGLSVLEALAVGAPIVGTNVGGLPEVVGPAGVLVPAEDVEGLTAALRSLTAAPLERERLSRLAFAQAGRYSWETAVPALEKSYEATLRFGKL